MARAGARPAGLMDPVVFIVAALRADMKTEWDSNKKTKIQIGVLVEFGPVSGQSWAADRYQRLRLEKRREHQRKLTRKTNYKASSRRFPVDHQ